MAKDKAAAMFTLPHNAALFISCILTSLEIFIMHTGQTDTDLVLGSLAAILKGKGLKVHQQSVNMTAKIQKLSHCDTTLNDNTQ